MDPMQPYYICKCCGSTLPIKAFSAQELGIEMFFVHAVCIECEMGGYDGRYLDRGYYYFSGPAAPKIPPKQIPIPAIKPAFKNPALALIASRREYAEKQAARLLDEQAEYSIARMDAQVDENEILPCKDNSNASGTKVSNEPSRTPWG